MTALADPLLLYPALADVSPTLAELGAEGRAFSVAAGETLFSESHPCMGFPLLLEGEVRVSRSSPDGRSLELYRVGPGEICLVSSACLFRSQPLTANGVTTRATTLMVIQPQVFQAWLEAPRFRNLVMEMFAERMADLSGLIDAIAFHRLDQRLAAALLGHGRELSVTHQSLAQELGTVREIVTRLLRRFEREGWVELSRERIRIVDSAALRAHAQQLV